MDTLDTKFSSIKMPTSTPTAMYRGAGVTLKVIKIVSSHVGNLNVCPNMNGVHDLESGQT